MMKKNKINSFHQMWIHLGRGRHLFPILMIIIMTWIPMGARKIGYKTDTPEITEEMEMEKGSFMVASQCSTCNNGHTLSELLFFGYDKQLNSSKETFFARNLSDRELTGISMYIIYKSMKGNMLHKRFVQIPCEIPAGETRLIELPTWDTQKSFFYHKSTTPKRRSTPYDVEFDLISFYLRF